MTDTELTIFAWFIIVIWIWAIAICIRAQFGDSTDKNKTGVKS